MFCSARLHGGEAAGVFRGERFGAGAEERDEEELASQAGQGGCAAGDDLGQRMGRPRDRLEAAPPLRVERQQAGRHGIVGGTRARVVVKEMHLVQAVALSLLFDREQEFGNERRDAGDGVRRLEKCGDLKAGILHAALHPLADDPDAPRFTERREGLRHKLREAFVELSDHALIGAEDDRADLSRGDSAVGRAGAPACGESRRRGRVRRCGSNRPARRRRVQRGRCSRRPSPSSSARRIGGRGRP